MHWAVSSRVLEVLTRWKCWKLYALGTTVMSKRVRAVGGANKSAKKSRKDGGSECDLLPDPQTMSREAKAAKSRVKAAFESMEAIDLLHVNQKRLERFSKDQKLSWVIGKYGWGATYSVGTCLNSLPCSLTEAHFLEKVCPGIGMEKDAVHLLSTFLSQQCPCFVASFPNDVGEVLAPPVGECCE